MSFTPRRPKYSLHNKVQDFTSKIERVISQVTCEKHDAEIGDICFHIVDDGGVGRGAICGSRSRKIFVGTSAKKERS